MFLDQFDLPILKFMSGFTGRSSFFDHCVYAVSFYDTFKGVAMMSLVWMAAFYRAPGEPPEKLEERQSRLLIVFAGSIVAVVLSRILQLVLHIHLRPIIAGLGFHFSPLTNPDSVSKWNSFPSDHAMLFMALATGLWQINRRIGIVAFIWTIVGINLPRVYLGLHYPSDVIAGDILGILCMLGFQQLPLRNISTRIVAWCKCHPATFFCIAFLVSEEVAHLFDDIRLIVSNMLTYFTTGR